ncbi:probable DNA-directed RNA polymerase I subunit RPA43 isoform X3 [Dioscorea cayenensis subsp. rotundata]|uniref:DNA-directed RNA polymerase subunit n=1 Tax=Dioscorea cayennensis subsp. rotundata TaxID=55577 RepID=A0AB40CG05_DIOCR|nr:probable DNA-directed RNA polymerase I subunit RPA43 isoform X3 [Dioscorea cayenensis subsp. rotundata]
MEGLTVADANLTVYVHPSNANKVKDALLRQLSSLLFKYDENFDGVILAYEIKFESKDAKILPGLHPLFGVKLKANLLLFQPKVNELLEGKVVKLGKECIHVIILGFSSATIMSEDIREEFKFRIKHGVEVFASSAHKRHVIKTGSFIRFLVKSLDVDILHVNGSLIPSNTGCIHWLSRYGTEDISETDRSLKRPKPIEEQDSQAMVDLSLNSNHHHKSHKRTVTNGMKS